MDTTSTPGEPVDPSALEALASLQEDGEPDLLVELITLFLRDTSARLLELSTPPLEAAAVARLAHSIKGSAGNLGAMDLQARAARLEAAATQGEPADTLANLVRDVESEYRRVERHLGQLRASRERAMAPAPQALAG